MISKQDLEELLAWEAEGEAPILSVYIDRRTGTGFWNAEDLARLAKAVMKDLPAEEAVPEGGAFEKATQAVLAALDDGSFRERSVAVFTGSSGRLKTLEWNLPVVSQARWGRTAYLLPLLEAVGGRPRWGVVLVDRAKARLFTMDLGSLEEERDATNPEPAQRVASTGTDQALTMNLQRRADEHVHLHIKRVAAALDEMSRAGRFERLILGGPTEPASRLHETLSPRLAEAFAGFIRVPVEADREEIREAALEAARRTEDGRSDAEVLDLETASAKREKAAAGLDGTLEALHEGRIRRLLYADGLMLHGRRCANCGSLFGESASRCGYCRGVTSPVHDLLNEIAGRVAKAGGTVESVGMDAGRRLRELGGVGAFLRF
jgi:peptide chain release factor subunit 1